MQNDPFPNVPTDAEQAVLGCIILRDGLIPDAARLLRPDDFGGHAERTTFAALLSLWHTAGVLDSVSLTGAMRAAGTLESVGGAPYLSALVDAGCFPSTLSYHADTVRRAAHVRAIARTCQQIGQDANSPGADPDAMASRLSSVLSDLTATLPRAALTMEEHLTAAVTRYETAFERRDAARLPGVYSTGLVGLDKHTEGGLHPGDLVILAAETSGGKTALAMQLTGVAAKEGAQTLFASYEMTTPQLTDRLVAHAAQVPASTLRSGRLTEAQMHQLAMAVPVLRGYGVHLRDGIGHWTIDDLASEARAVQAQGGLHLLVVDYLQLVAPRHAARGKERNREREVAEISRGLKTLATELGITVLALSQLNEDGRLRESRAIGQDADVVLILGVDPDAGDDRRQVRLDKNRHGARDRTVPLAWDGPLMRFADAPPRQTVSRVADL